VTCIKVDDAFDSFAATSHLIQIIRYEAAEPVIPAKHRKIFPTEQLHTVEKHGFEFGHRQKESRTRKMTKSGTRIALLGLSVVCNPIMMIRPKHMLPIAKKICPH